MAFPTIPTAGANTLLTSRTTTAGTSHTFPSLTTLDNASGDLLVAIICTYVSSTTNAEFSSWGASFTEFCDRASTGSTVMGIGAAYKFSDGTETGTFTVTSATSTQAAMFLLSVKGAHGSTPPEAGTKTDGTGAAADIASFNPTGWDVEDTLWIAVGAGGEVSTTGSFTGISAAPTNYTDFVATTLNDVALSANPSGVAFRQLAAASDDPGTFTADISNARNSSLLIAVRPAAAVSAPAGVADGVGDAGQLTVPIDEWPPTTFIQPVTAVVTSTVW